MKIRMLVILALTLTGLFVSVGSGGAPLGPSIAVVGEGRWAVGAMYGYEQSDVEAFGTVTERFLNDTTFFWTQPFRVDELQSNMVFGTLAYGICDTWDIFAHLGAADAQGTAVILPADTDALEREDDLDGNFGFAWGVGTRATFCQSGPWSFGGLAQVTWFQPGDSDFTVADPLIPDESWVGDLSLKYWQAQVALAAVYQVDTLRLWAGPFLQFVQGDMDFTGSAVLNGAGVSTIRWTSDLNESSQIGGHVGASLEITEEWDLWVGGQITEDSWLVGIGGTFNPERTFGL